MKKTTFVILISTMLVAACGTNNKTGHTRFVPMKPDTVKTLAVYVELPYTTIAYGVVPLIIKDRVSVDTFLNAKQFRDTIPYFLRKGDSVYTQTFLEAVSFDFNLDSAVKKMQQFVDLNKKQLKVDSSFSNYTTTSKK
jgi:hypothetical protein